MSDTIFFTEVGATYNRIESLRQEMTADDSDDVGVQSYPTSPITLLDLNEVNDFRTEFVYNYYTRDERTKGNGTVVVFDSSASEDAYTLYMSRNDQPPRQVRLRIKSHDWTGYYTDEAAREAQRSIESYIRTLGANPIKNFYDSIVSEDSLGSGYFSAAHLKDDYGDKQFYNEISSSVSFFGSDVNIVGSETLSEMGVDSDGAFPSDGRQVRKSLSNIQSKGVSYAPTDVRKEVSVDAFTSVTNIDFAMVFNNKLVGNSIAYSLNEKINIYDNELESLKEPAMRIQNTALASDNPGAITSDEFSFSVPTISVEVVDDAPLQGGFKVLGDTELRDKGAGDPPATDDNKRPTVGEFSHPIGFIIEKFEITQTEDGNWEKTQLNPILVQGFSSLVDILDTDVKYGATYIYNARIVTATRFETLRVHETKGDNDAPDQVVMATMLLKSSGVSTKIDCTESIPPNPPQNLRFHWDYQNDNLILFWEEALNKQRDVVRYQIFNRRSVDVPFTLIKELDFDKSTSKVEPVEKAPEALIQEVPGPRKSFRDKSFTKNSEKIYTLCGVDARGLTSNYSMQYKVRFDSSKNKLKVDVISRSGAPKPYPNIYLRRDLFVDTMRSSGMDRMRIFFDPEAFDVTRQKLVHGVGYNASQKLISNNYKVQIINVDNQMSKVININIKDDTGTPVEITVGTAESSFTRGF